MELFEWLSVLGGGFFCGVKILKRFYGWATWVAERKKELREWRLQGVKLCGNHGDKIDRFFCGPGRLLVAWCRLRWIRVLTLKKEFLTRRLDGVEPCGSWECGHWELSHTKAGGIALQHNDLGVWQSMREFDFYMERYEQFGIPVPAKVMSKI